MKRDTSRPNAHTQYKVETQKQEFLRDIPQNLQLCIAFENYGMLVCRTPCASFWHWHFLWNGGTRGQSP